MRTPSARPVYEGFEAYFTAVLAPYGAEKEREREAAVTNVLILAGATLFLAFAILACGPFGDANIQFAVFAGFAGAALTAWLLNRARKDITHGLVYRIAEKLGFSYRGDLQRPDYYERFRRLRLLPVHNRESWEDEVKGAHGGAAFVLCEAHLKFKTSGKNSSTRTVFHGQFLMIDYPRRFFGSTVVLRDMGPLNALMRPRRDYSRVGLASPAFEKAFEAWSTDQVEARDLLDPIVLERFQELERLYGGKKLRAAFDDGKILIAVETGDRMTIGTMFRPLDGAERVERILAEFDAVFDLIDVLLKRLERRTAGAFSIADVREQTPL